MSHGLQCMPGHSNNPKWASVVRVKFGTVGCSNGLIWHASEYPVQLAIWLPMPRFFSNTSKVHSMICPMLASVHPKPPSVDSTKYALYATSVICHRERSRERWEEAAPRPKGLLRGEEDLR
jgi:hypothetical protein